MRRGRTHRPSASWRLSFPMARGLCVVAAVLAAATCRVDRLFVKPTAALLCVTPSLPVGPFAQDTGYHWQARTRDATGNISAWVSFPIAPPNPETDVDFGYPSLPPAQLVFTVQPKNAKIGMSITPPVQVTVRDSLGRTSTGFTGPVTMMIAPNLYGAQLFGMTTVNAVAGVATFSNLIVDRLASGLRLRATTVQPSLTVLSLQFNVGR